jgi:anti-anti-sigma factor
VTGDLNDFFVHAQAGAEGGSVVSVGGEIDLSTGPELEATLLAAAREASHLVVDLTRCTFLSSTGLRALLRARRALADDPSDVIVVVPDPYIRKVFEIAGVESMFVLVDRYEGGSGPPAAA